ncbi:hypothetical protein LguiA_001727 [Lonicera macranthoides]
MEKEMRCDKRILLGTWNSGNLYDSVQTRTIWYDHFHVFRTHSTRAMARAPFPGVSASAIRLGVPRRPCFGMSYSCSSLFGHGPSAWPRITLKSSNGEVFQLNEIVALKSQTIKHMIEDDCADNGIPLLNVTGN